MCGFTFWNTRKIFLKSTAVLFPECQNFIYVLHVLLNGGGHSLTLPTAVNCIVKCWQCISMHCKVSQNFREILSDWVKSNFTLVLNRSSVKCIYSAVLKAATLNKKKIISKKNHLDFSQKGIFFPSYLFSSYEPVQVFTLIWWPQRCRNLSLNI